MRIRSANKRVSTWVYIREHRFKGTKLQQPMLGPFTVHDREDHSVAAYNGKEILCISTGDAAPSPVPALDQQVPPALLYFLTVPHWDLTSADGISYQFKSIITMKLKTISGSWYVGSGPIPGLAAGDKHAPEYPS